MQKLPAIAMCAVTAVLLSVVVYGNAAVPGASLATGAQQMQAEANRKKATPEARETEIAEAQAPLAAPENTLNESVLSESAQDGGLVAQGTLVNSDINAPADGSGQKQPVEEQEAVIPSETQEETAGPSDSMTQMSLDGEDEDASPAATQTDSAATRTDMAEADAATQTDLATPTDDYEDEIDPEEEELSRWRSEQFTEGLKPGDDNELIAILQERLMELGYMEPDAPTNEYGDKTKLAVSYFQRGNDLIATGEADLPTLLIMMSNEAQLYCVADGYEGDDVKEIQQRLSVLEYTVDATGVYDADTQERVKKFQEKNSLVQDGVVTLGTKAVLFSESAITMKGKLTAKKNVGVENLIAVAEQYVGVTYRLGGKGPDSFDCSGFVYYALNQSGFKIGYMTSAEWANANYTTITSMSELERGDIVCFRGHVGIYMGDGKMIDASSSEGRVRITSGGISNSSYWTQNFICGKRVF